MYWLSWHIHVCPNAALQPSLQGTFLPLETISPHCVLFNPAGVLHVRGAGCCCNSNSIHPGQLPAGGFG